MSTSYNLRRITKQILLPMIISKQAIDILEAFFEDAPGFLFVSLSRDHDIYEITFDPVAEPPSELFYPLAKHVLLDADAAPYLDGSILEWSDEDHKFYVALPDGTVDTTLGNVTFTFH